MTGPGRGGARRAAFAIGSNQGDRLAMLRRAVEGLAATPHVFLVAVSPVYETVPVGGPEQRDFLNAVVVADTPLSPRSLLDRALALEQAAGRVREQRWGPRTLDIDLLAVGDLVVGEPDLAVPHPRIAERAFVLIPWAHADPAAVLPGGVAVLELAGDIDRSGVHQRPDLVLDLPPTRRREVPSAGPPL